MTKKERNEIIKYAESLSDKELEEETIDALFDSLGSKAEEMYERGYPMEDIKEREEYEKFLNNRYDILSSVCGSRGIDIFEDRR